MLTNEQKLKLFKEAIDSFETDEIRNFATDLFAQMPDDSIIQASSSTGKYHNKSQCEVFGNLKHILMVGQICNHFLSLQKFQEEYPKPKQRDCIRLAAYTHDGVKYGWNGAQYTQFTHPIMSGEWVETAEVEHPIKPELRVYISDLIKSHSGNWNTSTRSKVELPVPETEDQWLLHYCDFLGSRSNIDMEYSDELKVTMNEILEELKDTYIMSFGKYNGESLKLVYSSNPGYFTYLEENGGLKEPMKTLISMM